MFYLVLVLAECIFQGIFPFHFSCMLICVKLSIIFSYSFSIHKIWSNYVSFSSYIHNSCSVSSYPDSLGVYQLFALSKEAISGLVIFFYNVFLFSLSLILLLFLFPFFYFTLGLLCSSLTFIGVNLGHDFISFPICNINI